MDEQDNTNEELMKMNIKYNIKTPTYKEEDLEQLERLVQKEMNCTSFRSSWLTDITLKRFLKAFGTVQFSFEALVKYSEWRIKYNVDNISSEQIQTEENLKRSVVFDDITDRYNRTIVVVYPANHNMFSCDYDSLCSYIIFKLEQVSVLCDKKATEQFCLIFDLKNFGLRNMDYTAVKKIVWFLKNCYPERLGVCLILNYPWLFYACYEVIKSWLNEVTKSKIIFSGRNELNDFVDLKTFPIQFFD